jgi:hypothetical protein
MTPNTILTAADKARADLREQLGSDAALVALAAALGRACAETGTPLAEVLALAEVAHTQAARAPVDTKAA